MKQKQETVKAWFGSGSPWVWMNAGAVSIAVIMTIGLLAVIAVRGLGHFWPANVIEATYQIPGEAAKTVIGEVVQAEEVPRARLRSAGMPVPEAGPEFMTRELLKLGNRELYGSDFSWVVGEWLQDIKRPEALMVLERREWGNFYGYLLSVKENGQVVAEGDAAVGELQKRMQRVDDLYAKLYKLEKGDIGGINHGLERLRLKERKLQLDGKLDAAAQADLAAERSELQARYKVLEEQLNGLHQEFNRDSVVMRDASGRESEITLGKLVHAYQPNAMGLGTKMTVYFKKLWEFLSDDPREANTEGGIFPAIFGTVMMTLVMALIVTPFGVIAAVYLREYAKQGPLTRVIRIAACLAILLSFSPKFAALVSAMPTATMGGVSMVLYGMISAVGVRNIVENQVDFTNSRNVIIAAIIMVLAIGVNYSGAVTFSVGSIEVSLSGLAVAAIAGIALNAVLPGKDYEFGEDEKGDTSVNFQV